MSNCYADPSPTFQPAMRIVSAITNANPASVTTTFDHDYITGTIVRVIVPPADGMFQINQLYAPITVTSPTTFTIEIDTTSFDVFSIPGGVSRHVNTCAMVIPIGEINSILSASVRNVL